MSAEIREWWFWGTFGRGLVLGLVMAAPVGPIGMLCIVRTLRFGRLAGLATGLGAATADATYATVAALGLATLTATLVSAQRPLMVFGAIALGAIGIRTMSAPAPDDPSPRDEAAPKTHDGGMPSPQSLYLGTVALTLANPATILTFIGILAASTTGAAGTPIATVTLVGAVFLGSALWWMILSSAVGLVRHRWLDVGTPGLDARRLRMLNAISGALLVGFGILAAVQALP